METYQIVSWLRDKAVRSGNHSWERMMMMAAQRLEQQEKLLEMVRAERDVVTKRMIELEQKNETTVLHLTPQVYPKGYQPYGFLGFARACPTCKNIGSEHCRECKMERNSGYEPKEEANE